MIMKTTVEQSVSPFARLLASTFTPEEIEKLTKKPRFQTALAVTHCYAEFVRLCEIGQKHLGHRPRGFSQN